MRRKMALCGETSAFPLWRMRLSFRTHLVVRVFLLSLLGMATCLAAENTVPVAKPLPVAPSLHLVGNPSVELDLAACFEVPGVGGEIAQFVTTSGTFNVELLPAAAPNHVENFRAYVAALAYDGTMFHRVAAFESGQGASILQGGGFSATIPVNPVAARPQIALEYALPNARGTLAAARTGDPHSATSQWYFNTRDNSTILGPENDGHGYTVFGRVLGTGMSVVDALAGHPIYNAGGTFASLPLRDIAPGQTQILPANFLTVQSVRMIPIYPASAVETGLLRFSVESATTSVATAEILAGRLLRITAHQPGVAEIVVAATDTNGNRATSTLSVTVGGQHQTVSFFGIYFTPRQWAPANNTVTLQAVSSAGLPVEFTVESGPATLTGNLLTYTGIGTVVIAARQPGDANTTPAPPAYLSLTMEKGHQSADFGDLPSQMPVNAPPFKALSTASSGLPVTLSVSGPATLSGDGQTITLTGEEGLVRILPAQAGNEFYHPLYSTGYEHLIAVSRLPQIVGFPALADRPIDPGLNPIPLAAVSDSGLPITYTVDSGPAVLTEDGRALIVTGAGTVTVSARQTGNGIFAPAIATIHFSATRLPQQINFPEIADQVFRSKRPGDNSLTLEAEAGSGLPIGFTLVSGAGTITGDTLALTRQDRFTVRASQPGNAFYEAAETVERSFVARSDARIVFDAWYENGNYTRVADVPAVIAPGSLRPFAVSATLDDGPSTSGIELELLSNTAYLSSYYNFSGLSVSRTVIGTAYHNPARVTPTGATGPITLLAYRTVDADLHLEPSATFTVHVGRTQTIRFDQPKPMPLAQGGITVRPTSSSKLPVTLEVVSGPATVTPNTTGGYQVNATDSGIVVLRATQPGGGVFAPATPVVREWIVQGQAQTLEFALPATATYGDTPLPLVASSNLATEPAPRPVTFSIVSGPGVIEAADDKLRLTGAGKVVVRATQAGGGGVGPALVTRTLTVRKAVLQVRGVPAHRLVGATDFNLSLAYTGFVGDDNAAYLDTPPRARTTATKSSPAGVYPITFAGGADDSYEFAVGAPAGTLTLHGFGGAYEALITAESGALLGKVALTLSSKAVTYSGTLALAETGTVLPLLPASAAALNPTTDAYEAVAGLALAKMASTSSGTLYHRIEFTVSKAGLFAGVLKRDKVDGGMNGLNIVAEKKGDFSGRRLYAGKTAPWEGRYTTVFLNHEATDYAVYPLGAGWATASISKAGSLGLTGRLADDSILTATVASDELGGFRLFHNPYGKRADSYLGGNIALTALDAPDATGRHHVPFPPGAVLAWRKAPRSTASGAQTQDALFPAGFGPVTLIVAMDPWTPPVSTGPASGRISLGQRLGLADDNMSAVGVAVSLGDGDYGAGSAGLPGVVSLRPDNLFAAPSPNVAKWSLRVVDAKTGRFAGSFILQDEIAAPTAANPAAKQPVTRPVSFTGVLRQSAQESGDTPLMLGAGYLVLKPLPAGSSTPTTAKPESHEIRLGPAP